MSSSFRTDKGVKQGGISSCPLFLLIIDLLLNELQLNDLGLKIRFNDEWNQERIVWAGALAYADDLCIIFPPEHESEIKNKVNQWSTYTGMIIADKSNYFILNETNSD